MRRNRRAGLDTTIYNTPSKSIITLGFFRVIRTIPNNYKHEPTKHDGWRRFPTVTDSF